MYRHAKPYFAIPPVCVCLSQISPVQLICGSIQRQIMRVMLAFFCSMCFKRANLAQASSCCKCVEHVLYFCQLGKIAATVVLLCYVTSSQSSGYSNISVLNVSAELLRCGLLLNIPAVCWSQRTAIACIASAVKLGKHQGHRSTHPFHLVNLNPIVRRGVRQGSSKPVGLK